MYACMYMYVRMYVCDVCKTISLRCCLLVNNLRSSRCTLVRSMYVSCLDDDDDDDDDDRVADKVDDDTQPPFALQLQRV